MLFKIMFNLNFLKILFSCRERRKEKDKDNTRQKESLAQMEGALATRERIYKERIKGLEQQVEVLKDQLAKEARRRQVFISGKEFNFNN